MTTAAKVKRGSRRCIGCESPIGVDRDGLCAKCHDTGEYEWCRVCREYQATSWGDHCRHLFWTDCGYAGAGSYEHDWDRCREGFFALLDILSRLNSAKCLWDEGYADLVDAIEVEVGKNCFYTSTIGLLIGGAHTIEFMRLRPDLPNVEPGVGLTMAWIDIESFPDDVDLDGPAEEGFGWLQSLEDEETPDANARTVAWIRLWRADRRLNVIERGGGE